jgi:P4 family phage/plasmid primase-like protien
MNKTSENSIQKQQFDTKTLRRLLSYMKDYKGQLIFVVVCILLSAIASAASALFLQSLIDDYIAPLLTSSAPVFTQLLNVLVVIGAVYLIGVLATLFYNRVMVTIAQGTLKKIRDEMFEKMHRLPIRAFDTRTHGDIMSLYTNDTDTLRQMIAQSMAQLISSVFTIVAVFVCMLYVSFYLTLVAVLVMLLILQLVKKITGKIGVFFVMQQKTLADVNGYVEEMVNGQKVIKVFCHEETAKKELAEKNRAWASAAASANGYANSIMPMMNALGYVQYVIIGYCLIPSNKGQRMMVMKGNGGEGKSQIGAVLGALLGSNMKDGSIGKISENRFARADLEHILLCVDDDMRMEALRQTNYVKSIVTAQGKMDLERKGKQSYQGWMFARLLAFSNGDLQALYDRSDGFYRRQLVLTTKEKPVGRVDDPDLAEKMKAEAQGIFLWAFEGLQRLVANNFKFTESQRTQDNREAVKRDNNNVFDFLESEGYIRLKADCTISSKDLYEIYRMWCEENNLTPLKRRSFSDSVIASQSKYNLEYCNKITNAAGRRVWGFFGIEVVARPNINGFSDVSERTYVPEEWQD